MSEHKCKEFLDSIEKDYIYDNEDGTYDLSTDIYLNGEFEDSDYMRIKYCPFCGVKLKNK